MKSALETHVGKIIESCSIFRSVPIMASDSISFLMIGGDDLATKMRSERVWRKFVAVLENQSTTRPAVARYVASGKKRHYARRQHSYHDHRWSRESCSIGLSRQSRPGSGRENAVVSQPERSCEIHRILRAATAESSSTLGSYRCATELASSPVGTMHCLLQRKLLTQQLKSGSAITMLRRGTGHQSLGHSVGREGVCGSAVAADN